MEATIKKPAARKTAVKKPVAHPPASATRPLRQAEHVGRGHERAGKPAAKKPVHHVEAAPVVETAVVEKPAKIHHSKTFYAVGRRKTSVAQVLTSVGNGTITINQLPFEKYFQTGDLQYIAIQPFVSLGLEKSMNVKAKLQGGGIHSQAEAFRHAVTRSLIAMDPESRRTLKKLGYLKRDPRVKERKKPGLKRARRAPQFSKR